MTITFDPSKRDAALAHRGLDFADAARVFEGDHATWLDGRTDYGEVRQITAGWLDGRMIVFVWTGRESMARSNQTPRSSLHPNETIRWLLTHK